MSYLKSSWNFKWRAIFTFWFWWKNEKVGIWNCWVFIKKMTLCTMRRPPTLLTTILLFASVCVDLQQAELFFFNFQFSMCRPQEVMRRPPTSHASTSSYYALTYSWQPKKHNIFLLFFQHSMCRPPRIMHCRMACFFTQKTCFWLVNWIIVPNACWRCLLFIYLMIACVLHMFP